MSTQQPPGTLSPDRLWLWDGRQWVPAPPQLASSGTGWPPSGLPATPRAPTAWLAVAGAVVALLGEVLLVVAYALPYGTVDNPTQNLSIFNPGIPNGLLAAMANLVEILVGIATALAVLVAFKNRTLVAVASGLLIGLGVMNVFDWIATLIAWTGSQGSRPGVGSAIAIGAGLIVLVGGVLACVSVALAPRAGVTDVATGPLHP